jgi:predicted aconitase
VAVIDGLPADLSEDRLKAIGAAAASSGAVGLFHVAGVTPEAPDAATALGGQAPAEVIRLTPDMLRATRERLSTAATGAAGRIDAVALGSPHFSLDEFADLERLAAGQRFAVPVYVCTARDHLARLEADGRAAALQAAGVEIVVDTCVVVAPVLPDAGGVLMTNSGKFAHYTPANTGYAVVFGSLADCVASAVAGRVVRDEGLWR